MFDWLLRDWFGILYLVVFIINIVFSIYLMFNYLRRTGIFQFISSFVLLILLSAFFSRTSEISNIDKIVRLFNTDFYLKIVILLNLVLYIFFILNLLRIVNLRIKQSGEFNEKIKRNK
jgi:hypothetical protein